MFKDRRSIITLLFCLLSGRAAAENLNIKPGLWELTSTYEAKGTPPMPAAERAEMERNMAKMPPEMRAKMETAVKSSIANLAKPIVKKSCLLKEDLDKALAFDGGRGDGTCTRTIVKSTPSVQEIRMDCSKGTQKSSGTLRMVAADPESWSGTMEGTISDTGGATGTKAKMSGKWLGADCGNVKASSRK